MGSFLGSLWRASPRVAPPLGMRGGIGRTLLTAFLALAIFPLGLLAFVTYHRMQDETERRVYSSLATVAALKSAHLADWASGTQRELGLLGPTLDPALGGDRGESEAQLTAWQDGIETVLLFDDRTGQVLTSIGRDAGLWREKLAGRPPEVADGQLAIVAADGSIANPAFSGSDVPVATFTNGTMAALGQRVGTPGDGWLAVGLVPVEWLDQLVSIGLASGQGDGSEQTSGAALQPAQADQPGSPQAPEGASGGDLRGASLGTGIRAYLVTAATLSSMATTDPGAMTGAMGSASNAESQPDSIATSGWGTYVNAGGVPLFGAYHWDPTLQVAVVAEQRQAEAFAAGNTLAAAMVAIALGMALVTAASAAVVTRRVTQPLVQLTETAARMAQGDLEVQVAVSRQDEIGVLARAFNRMGSELRVLYGNLEAKVELLTNMSHALRTPLTSIIGFSRLMLKEMDGPLTEIQRTDLAAIHEGGQQLLELINDMLELSDLELETAPMTVDEVDLAQMVDGVMATARALALKKPVELVEEIADGLPTLYTDGRRVRRVLLALLSNAVRITEEGTIRLSVTAGDGQVKIGVQITGAKEQPRIFDLGMGNGELSPHRDIGQSSLGLTVSRQVVEKLGGRIWMESNGSGDGRQEQPLRAGEGGRLAFTFTLPISPSDIRGGEQGDGRDPQNVGDG